MKHFWRVFWLLAMVSLSTDSWAQSGSDTEITGEISARIDGERVVWQSFDAHGRAGALWRRQDVDTGRVAMAAFEATPVPFSDPDWHGSQITLSLEFPLDGSSVTHRLAQGADGPASLHIVPAAGDYERMLMIGDGIVAATDVVLRPDGSGRFEGHFAGTLVDEDGNPAGRVTDGAFSMQGAEQVARQP